MADAERMKSNPSSVGMGRPRDQLVMEVLA
jgi:hypothetical protein